MNRWMTVPGKPENCVAVFRGIFAVQKDEVRRVVFSADMRAQVYLDGDLVANGPERGAVGRWYSKPVDLTLTKGEHTLCARVLCISSSFYFTLQGQMTQKQGFFIHGLDEASWTCQLEKVEYADPFPDWGAFPRVKVLEGYNNEILKGQGGEWLPVEFFDDDRELFAPDLPEMRHEPVEPVKIENGIYRFDNYVVVWPVYHFKGQGTVKLRWAENPYLTDEFDDMSLKGKKGNRDGHVFICNGDEFQVDGELDYPGCWFRAGRYVLVEADPGVEFTAEYYRTGLPLPEAPANSEPLVKLAYASLQNCCWETFMDCPYYEQLMYVGDSRVEALILYRMTNDNRLPAKALRLFALGQQPDGQLLSQYPSKGKQIIPSYMPIFLLMLDDYYTRFGREGLVEDLLPVAGRLVDWLAAGIKDDQVTPVGWGFVDWCEGWKDGVPPGADGHNSLLNLLWALGLRAYAHCSGRTDIEALAVRIINGVRARYFDSSRGLMADDSEHQHFSEHGQILSILADIPEKDIIASTMHREKSLTPCSIYFSYYYMEAMRLCGADDLIEARIDRFRTMADEGLKTLPEEFVNPRSDCHGWGSYVLMFMKDSGI